MYKKYQPVYTANKQGAQNYTNGVHIWQLQQFKHHGRTNLKIWRPKRYGTGAIIVGLAPTAALQVDLQHCNNSWGVTTQHSCYFKHSSFCTVIHSLQGQIVIVTGCEFILKRTTVADLGYGQRRDGEGVGGSQNKYSQTNYHGTNNFLWTPPHPCVGVILYFWLCYFYHVINHNVTLNNNYLSLTSSILLQTLKTLR